MQRSARREPAPTTLSLRPPGYGLTAAIFFALFFLYVCFRIEPVLEYQHACPVFRLTRSFLSPFLAYPGGLADYAAAFLAQLNYYNWLGAGVYTAIAVLIFLGSSRILASITSAEAPFSPFGMAFLLLVLGERYDSPALTVSFGLLAALLGAACYVGFLKGQSCIARMGLCWVFAGVLFYVAGVWPCLFLLLLAGLFEGLKLRRPWCALMVAPPVLAGSLWLASLPDFAAAPFLNPWCKGRFSWLLVSAFFVMLPLECVVRLWRQSPTPSAKPQLPNTRTRGKKSDTGLRPRQARPVAWALLFAGGWVFVWLSLATGSKRVAEIDYYASQKNYARVLDLAGALERREMDFASESRLHLALYHTGRLSADLFSYQNQGGWDLFPGVGSGLESCRAQSQALLELGLIGEAEHLAHEALESEGERPELLRLLAQVNVLKERPRAARVFLNVLSQVPFQKGWAEERLQELERDPRLTNNRELAAIRSVMLTNDVAHQVFPAEGMLIQLLRRNPTNQMAFEYLMAHYLVTLEINKLVDRLWQLDNFAYTGIPRHYEEALLLYQQLKGTIVELRGRKVRPETAERFQRFIAALDQRLSSTAEGRQALARDFGGTYWYYHFTRRSQAKQS